MRRILQKILRWAYQRLHKRDLDIENRDLKSENRILSKLVSESQEQYARQEAAFRISELIEARQMAGIGPWRVSKKLMEETDRLIMVASERLSHPGSTRLREALPSAVGATSDIELALQNVGWQREINLSWLEFSRWGIQQMILISRLYYIKNPLIQRGINVVAYYVFGRGIEVMSEDDTSNAVLKECWERNKSVLGQTALSELQKRSQYDGQIFFQLFSDTQSSGEVTVRTIDATEVFEIITAPGDTDQPYFYLRKWTERLFDEKTGETATKSREAYYPALDYKPENHGNPNAQPQQINKKDVMWTAPVYRMKGGTGISKWHFDCPKIYAALDYAHSARRWLTDETNKHAALSQIAMTLTTKGGQQALEGGKQQLQTGVGPGAAGWDTNPPAVSGSTFASGPGTVLAAFNTKGASGDVSFFREIRNFVACVLEIPPTWLGDMETSNLSTATTLDRPTELGMYEKQERWREALTVIANYVLRVSQGATSGILKEAGKGTMRIVEAARKRLPSGRIVYEAKQTAAGEISVKVNFPAIREGDLPELVKAIKTGITLDNANAEPKGMDLRVGVGLLYQQFDVEDYGDVLDKQFPTGTYEMDRTKLPPPEPANPNAPKPKPNGQA